MIFWLSINLLIIFSFNQFAFLSLKCQKMMENAHRRFLKPKATSSGVFCSADSPKPKDVHFTIIYRYYQTQKTGKYSHLGN